MRVDLSLAGDRAGHRNGGDGSGWAPAALRRWTGIVDTAHDACLVLDRSARVVACSTGALVLLGMPGREATIGHDLLDGLVHPVDFTAGGQRLADWELAKLPPLAALTTGGLARGLIRLRHGHGVRTVDAVATPLRDEAEMIGSLTFFHEI
ncbi:MAG TPA: PAS domain-containing protein [Actinocatenispora sp.]